MFYKCKAESRSDAHDFLQEHTKRDPLNYIEVAIRLENDSDFDSSELLSLHPMQHLLGTWAVNVNTEKISGAKIICDSENLKPI
jgi:hypothetical protein